MKQINPSRSLNNKSIFLGLELNDLVLLALLLIFLRSLYPKEELFLLYLLIVGFVGGLLSIIKTKFRKGFLYSVLHSFYISIFERIK